MIANNINIHSLKNKVFINLVAFIFGFAFLMPFIIMISGSFTSASAFPGSPLFWIPKDLHLDNYAYIFTRGKIFTWFKNSLIITLVPVVCTVFISALLGYVFAKKKFWGRNFIFWMFLSMIMVPQQMLVIPRYLLFDKMGWIDTYYVFLVPFIWDITSMFIMKQFIQIIPKDMEEAAIIDGCTNFGIFLNVILPLSKPAMATVATFQFIAHWNDLFYPLIFATSENMYPMTVGLVSFMGETSRFGFQMACAVINFIPTFVMFIFLQKYFIEGITTTGLKG